MFHFFLSILSGYPPLNLTESEPDFERVKGPPMRQFQARGVEKMGIKTDKSSFFVGPQSWIVDGAAAEKGGFPKAGEGEWGVPAYGVGP